MTVFIELPRDFSSDVGQCDVFIRLNQSLYGQAKYAHLWYENLQNCLLGNGFMVSKVDAFLFVSKTVIFVVYVDGFIF